MATSQPKDDSKTADRAELATVTSYTDNGGQGSEIDEAYLRASSLTKFYRSVLFQMILFGA